MMKLSKAMIRAMVILCFSEIESIDGSWCALDDPNIVVRSSTLGALYRRGLCTTPLSYGGRGMFVVRGSERLEKTFCLAVERWEFEMGRDAWETFVEGNPRTYEMRKLMELYEEEEVWEGTD